MELLQLQVLAPSQWSLSSSPPPLSPREPKNLASRLPPRSTFLFFHLRRSVNPTLVVRHRRWGANAGNPGPGGFGYDEPRDEDGDGVGFDKWVRRKEKRRKKRWWRSYDSSKRRWWSDGNGDEDEDEEDEEPVGIWEEVIDAFWVLKVRSDDFLQVLFMGRIISFDLANIS